MGILTLIKWIFRLFRNPLTRGMSSKAVTGVIDNLLGEKGEKLPGLLSKLTTGGLGDTVQSWIAKGKNKSLSADEVKSVLGSESLTGLASQLGTSEDKAASKVAKSLPQLINELTPDGEVPDQQTLSQRLAEMLKR